MNQVTITKTWHGTISWQLLEVDDEDGTVSVRARGQSNELPLEILDEWLEHGRYPPLRIVVDAT